MHLLVSLVSLSALSIPFFLLARLRRRPTTAAMARAYVLHNRVSHVRLLPESAQHTFSYPTLSLLLSLSALESGALDLAHGWVFGYGGTAYRLTGLRSSAYLFDDGRSMRDKLIAVLEGQGLKGAGEELGEVWVQTMPAYCGWEGINPLSVYYCYRRAAEAGLWAVVLEVHNTFGERHVYVLQVGVREDPVPKNADHQWTFPRQFHVSPFNDRSGHYVCSVVVPPPPSASSSTAPLPRISITQLTSGPSPSPKLVAVFAPTRSMPLTTPALLLSLLKRPLDLLLTTPRILWEAAHLHWARRLDVYPLPAPVSPSPAVEAALGQDRNPVEDDAFLAGRTVHWNRETWAERWARARTEAFLLQRVHNEPVRIRLVPSNPSLRAFEVAHPRAAQSLTVVYRSPRFFTTLLTTTDSEEAFLLGARANREFSASDEKLFTACFAPFYAASRPSPKEDLAHRLRLLTIPPHKRPQWLGHYLDEPADWTLIFVLGWIQLAAVVERWVCGWVGVRFVSGEEPWMAWERLERAGKAGRDPPATSPP